MASNSPFSILINSSDGFEDCWQPFFVLFNKYWPDCDAPILLNTERKNWAIEELSVRCTQVALRLTKMKRLTWSECLMAALDQVETPLVLYLQEDYFLEQSVDVSLVKDMANLMISDPSVKHIGLTHFGSCGPFSPASDPRLWKISPKSKYLISTQAGLWKVDTLKAYIRAWENGWMFEIFGTRRARRKGELFLTLNRDVYNPENKLAIQYLHTGIIKGQWHKGIQSVFNRHGIVVDFGRRGFYQPRAAFFRRFDLLTKLVGRPIDAVRSIFG